MMRNDQNRDFTKKREEEESLREKMDPACLGCHQRIVSQGCACSRPKSKPKLKSKTPHVTNEKNSETEEHPEIGRIYFKSDNDDTNQLKQPNEMNKDTWIQEKDGSFTYIKPGFFSMNVNDQKCTLFFSKKSPDFDKVYEAFNQFELDNNLILNKDFKIIKNSEQLLISFSNPQQYGKFMDHLLNKTTGLSNELQLVLRSLPKLAPKGSKKIKDEEIDNVEKKSMIKSPFRIPNPNQGPTPFDL